MTLQEMTGMILQHTYTNMKYNIFIQDLEKCVNKYTELNSV